MVVSILRMTGDHYGEIKPGLFDISEELKFMGMDPMNLTTVGRLGYRTSVDRQRHPGGADQFRC